MTDGPIALLLGGNLGNTERIFARCREAMNERWAVVRVSSLYRTEAWQMEGAPDFLNQALLIRTGESPQEVLEFCQKLEQKAGRGQDRPELGYQSRVLDIDLLHAGRALIDEESLTLPHPRLHLRRFSLVPLQEVDPGWEHPVYRKDVETLLRHCPDQSRVEKL